MKQPVNPFHGVALEDFAKVAETLVGELAGPEVARARQELATLEASETTPAVRAFRRLVEILKGAAVEDAISRYQPALDVIELMIDVIEEAPGATNATEVFEPLGALFEKHAQKRRSSAGGRRPKSVHITEALELFDRLRPGFKSNNAALDAVVSQLSKTHVDPPTKQSVKNWVDARVDGKNKAANF